MFVYIVYRLCWNANTNSSSSSSSSRWQPITIIIIKTVLVAVVRNPPPTHSHARKPVYNPQPRHRSPVFRRPVFDSGLVIGITHGSDGGTRGCLRLAGIEDVVGGFFLFFFPPIPYPFDTYFGGAVGNPGVIPSRSPACTAARHRGVWVSRDTYRRFRPGESARRDIEKIRVKTVILPFAENAAAIVLIRFPTTRY